MTSLRKKVTTYFRQLSFIAESRDSPRSTRKAEDDGNFTIKYLEGRMERIFLPAPEIFHGKDPTDLPAYKIGTYPTGPNTITAACTGPDEGLTGIKRSKLHLSAIDDIDFIDTIQESDCYEVRKSINSNRNQNKFNRFNGSRKLSNGAITPTNDQNANKMPPGLQGMRSRKNSKTGIAMLNGSNNTNNITKDITAKSTTTTSTTTATRHEDNSNKSTTIVVSMISSKTANDQNNKNLLNSKTELTKSLDIHNTNAQIKDLTTAPAISAINTGTTKLLEDTTVRLREALTSQASVSCGNDDSNSSDILVDSIAGVTNWQMESDSAYGISVSLYENNMLTKEPMGSPIADCYGLVVRGDSAAMALADGVNWGDGARLAARSAVQGCLDYLDRAIFGMAQECMATTTQEVFVSLLRSLWEGHGCILEVGGALSTVTIAVVLPLHVGNKYVVCACNVGDSLGYVYSKKHGVREFTQASHDITSMRDMRDALGAIGPADGNKPELSNLTFTMTLIESGDIVFLTSDGVSDNFDPVVGKFAEAWTPDVKLVPNAGVLAPKRQNKSASAIYARLHRNDTASCTNAAPLRPPRTKKSSSPEPGPVPSRPKYMRSHTVIEPRRLSGAGNQPTTRHMSSAHTPKIPKSAAGLPLVTGPQRHALTLHRLEDMLSYGINGTFSPCVSARSLCHLLIDFVRMITSARRKTLEQRELFYKLSNGADGIKREVELNRMQHRAARKRIIDSSAYTALPGKLDHATVVAFTVPGDTNAQNSLLQSKEFQETNF